MTSECSRLHLFILSGSAGAVFALRRLHATTWQWTWRSHRKQGIPRLDEPLSASQECLLQQSLLDNSSVFVFAQGYRSACVSAIWSHYIVAHKRNTKFGFQFTFWYTQLIQQTDLISCMKCEKMQSVQKGAKITQLVFAPSAFHCALRCVYISRNRNVLTAFV
jgi:hypothetical protein